VALFASRPAGALELSLGDKALAAKAELADAQERLYILKAEQKAAAELAAAKAKSIADAEAFAARKVKENEDADAKFEVFKAEAAARLAAKNAK